MSILSWLKQFVIGEASPPPSYKCPVCPARSAVECSHCNAHLCDKHFAMHVRGVQ